MGWSRIQAQRVRVSNKAEFRFRWCRKEGLVNPFEDDIREG